MWNPFQSKPLLSKEQEQFQLEAYRWLLTNFDSHVFYDGAQLVLPTDDFFPGKAKTPEEKAQNIFEQVKKLAGLELFKCKLVPQEEDPDLRVSETIAIQSSEQNPHGTFSMNVDQEVIITYNPKLTSNPMQLIATFAHELAHYFTAMTPIDNPPPGGWDNWELATDIAATYLGFGIFMGNSTFNFQQFGNSVSQGWQMSRSGYLTEEEHSYALAIFLFLKDIDPKSAFPHCNADVRSFLKKALKELKDKPYIEELRKVKYVQPTQQESTDA